jgi:hypothetical protein
MELNWNTDLLTGGIDSVMIDDEVDAHLNISMYSRCNLNLCKEWISSRLLPAGISLIALSELPSRYPA